jgi:7-carboxy-7-deazaguanine synthase
MEKTMKTAQAFEKTVLISEIFYSLQGEGPWMGLPASFIRLAGCLEPLCPWCDTPYALEDGRETAIGEILSGLGEHPTDRVVITGGEPFLQWGSGLQELHAALRDQGREIQYETSGKAGIPPVNDALVVCSPKHVAGAWRIDARDMGRVDFFKFLAGGKEWFRAIVEFVERFRIDREKVYIMALGATREQQIRGMEAVFSFCAEHGYRMSPRLHILAFDTRRGV